MARIVALIVMLTISTPAAADLYIELGDRAIYIPIRTIFAIAFILLIFILAKLTDDLLSAARNNASNHWSQVGSAEHYDNEANRYRALQRQLDAETEYIESQIRA